MDALFKLLKPVTSFFDAPWPGDARLHLAIDSYWSCPVNNGPVSRVVVAVPVAAETVAETAFLAPC